jgi:hypothetical protein
MKKRISNKPLKSWLPLYDVFRNSKKEFEIDLASIKLFSVTT